MDGVAVVLRERQRQSPTWSRSRSGEASVALTKSSLPDVTNEVPFQYLLSLVRWTERRTTATPVASADVPQMPVGLHPALYVGAE